MRHDLHELSRSTNQQYERMTDSTAKIIMVWGSILILSIFTFSGDSNKYKYYGPDYEYCSKAHDNSSSFYGCLGGTSSGGKYKKDYSDKPTRWDRYN